MLKIGDKVRCRYFNTLDKRFYGEIFTAEIIEIQAVKGNYDSNYNPRRDFVMRRLDDKRIITIWRKEIKGVIK